MATRLINRSRAKLDLLVQTNAGDKILCVLPNQQTSNLAQPKAVKPSSNFDRLMDANDWLQINTDLAVVYHLDNIDELGLSSLATLHCVPFLPNGAGPFNPGYQVIAEPTASEVDDPTLVEPADPSDAADGEFVMPNLSPFGHYVRTKVNNKTYITVRLSLYRMLGASDVDLANIKPVWKEEIEQTWNAGVLSGTGQKYYFEVDWTDRCPHSSIGVWKRDFRANMFHWPLDIGKRSPTDAKPTFPVAAHEFGHHLGLSDGYLYQGEIPDLKDAMEKNVPRYKNKKIHPTIGTYFWYMFGLNPVTAPRAAERLANFASGPQIPQNIMTGAQVFGPTGTFPIKGMPPGSHLSFATVMKTVDQPLIDAIENQELQDLGINFGEFFEKENIPGHYEDGYFDV